ncbi:MAG: SIS domain-containing protein [Bacillota bacterium]|nr:SIS domain-containing protein [Bacillota bacterium]
MENIQEITNYFENLKGIIDKIDKEEIQNAIDLLIKTRDEKKHIFIMGNGGSAATASHYAGDFNKGLSLNREKRFRFICLNDNAPTVLSLANDVNYESIFVEQLKNFLDKDDLIIAISGSGNSKNVINAVEYAHKNGNTVIGLTGFNGGKLIQLSDVKLHVPIDNMQIVEDMHMVFDHLMMSVLYNQ